MDTELAKYCQGDKTVEDYFSGLLTLWNEKDSMIPHTVPLDFLTHVIKIQEESHIGLVIDEIEA